MDNIITKFDAEDPENIAKRWERWTNNLTRFFRIKKIADDKVKKGYLFFAKLSKKISLTKVTLKQTHVKITVSVISFSFLSFL